MGPKKKDPSEGKAPGKGGDQKDQGESKAGGKGKEGGAGQLPATDDEGSPAEKHLPPEEICCPPPVVRTEEFGYNTTLSLEQLQEIYALSANLEDAARNLAVILKLGDCVFDARNLIVLEYSLGNLMFAKQAGLNLNQSLEIYDLGHMVLDLIRDGKPFAEAEWLFKNRLLSRSIVQYKVVAPDPIEKENDQPKENDQAREGDEPMDAQKQKESKKSKDTVKPKDGKKSKKANDPTEVDKLDETKKSKKDDKSKEANNPLEAEKLYEPKKDIEQDGPLFSRLDIKKITPYFTSTVFQHYCLYQYCFTRMHYNIRREERVFVETALTYPLSEAKSQEEVDAEEVARVAAEEKARQDAFAEQWLAEQSMFASIAAEAKRLADEELARKALTLDEYIERAVRHRIEEAKKEIIEEYEYREHFLIDKILQRQKEQETAAAAFTAKNAAIAEKIQPADPAVPDKKKKREKTQPAAPTVADKKKKGK